MNSLKERLKKAGSQSVTNCNRLKLPAAAKNEAKTKELTRRRGDAEKSRKKMSKAKNLLAKPEGEVQSSESKV